MYLIKSYSNRSLIAKYVCVANSRSQMITLYSLKHLLLKSSSISFKVQCFIGVVAFNLN